MKNLPPSAAAWPQRLAQARVGRVICSATPPGGSRPPRQGDAFAVDRHNQREMLYVLEGRSSFLYRNRIWSLSPGTLVVMDAWESHAFGYRPADDGLLHLWLGLHPPRISCTLLRVERGRYRGAAHLPPLAGLSFDFLSRQWGEALSGGKTLDFQAPLLSGVAETAMRTIAMEIARGGEGPDVARDLADFVADYIARQHGRDCSLSRIERVTGYSRYYLSRLFHRKRGMTIGAAVAHARRRFFAEAQAQGLKQRTIAEALGFSSPSAFCLWKRRQGL